MLEPIGPALARIGAGGDQQRGDRLVGLRGREIERRVAAAVLGPDSAPSSSSSRTIAAVLEHRKMQRRAMMLEAAHLAHAQVRRIGGDELAHQVGAVQRDRREDRRLGAARQQIVGDLARTCLKQVAQPITPTSCASPSPSMSAPAVDQALDHGERSELRGPVQGGRVVAPVARRDIEATAQQHVDAIEMTCAGRDVQQRATPLAAGDGDLARVLSTEVSRAPPHAPSAAEAMI